MTTLDLSPSPALSSDLSSAPSLTVRDVLDHGGVRSVFQPIVDLDSGAVVAFEALARGPVGPLESPGALFAAARADGLLAELDQACRAAAFRGAVDAGLVSPLTVFVNVEPEVLDSAPVDELVAIAEQAPGRLRVVLEITERALAARPAELLQTVARVRDLGWGVALDDVGADAASLAFMPLLRPDVIKLDLSLVQGRPDAAVAEIMNAVNAHAEHAGAVVLAEGIETEQHLVTARALGATLGQGWLFGRPSATPQHDRTRQHPLRSPSRPVWQDDDRESPFACLPPGTTRRRAPKALLVEISKQLEREAMRLGRTCVVAATFQHARHFTASTAMRYRDLVERTGFVCAMGEGLSTEPLPGLRGADLAPEDAVVGEWDVVVLAPHFSAALLARDLGSDGPDLERLFEYAVTYDRDTVVRASHALLSRVVPARPRSGSAGSATQRPAPSGSADVTGRSRTEWAEHGELPWGQALEVTTNGVTVADMTRPDQPLVFVNAAFERLSGYDSEVLLGRNCRFLQGPDTDDAAVSRIRRAVVEGRPCRELLLNYRGPDREPWWNEVHLSPVRDAQGRVTQYIGVQNDVTAQVRAERSLLQQSDLSRSYLAEIERLAFTDPLTGLMNRRGFVERVEEALRRSRVSGGATAVLFVDLDGFKAVNDAHGHGAGDELLTVLASRLADVVRPGDLLARLGGDEFLVALTGLEPRTARAGAQRVADSIAEVCATPVDVQGTTLRVGASVGLAVHPEDAPDLRALLHCADDRMYDLKHRRRG